MRSGQGSAPRGGARRFVLVWVGLAVSLVIVAACGGGVAHEFAGYERAPAPTVGDQSLPRSDGGGDLAFVAPDAGLLVVYFGYTHCPDICPTTMADLALALDELGDDADRVLVAMATVDPARDTDEVLDGYVTSFVADAIGLRTTDEERLRAAMAPFGADFLIEVGEDGEPEVGHTTALYAVDDSGTLRLTWSFGTPAGDLSADLAELLTT